MLLFKNIAGSSKGRTSGFGPENWGSSPYPAAELNGANFES